MLLALPCSAHAEKNILIFGDSLSAGYGIARDDSWANLLQQELRSSHPQYRIINASISGETTAGGLRRIDKALQEHHPEIVILELGANDGLRGSPLTEAEINLGKMIAQSRKAGARVLLLGMQLPPNYGPEYTRQFHAMYPTLAKHHKIPLVPFMLAGVAPEQFQPDNLHPNAAGQTHILHNVLAGLKPLLSVR